MPDILGLGTVAAAFFIAAASPGPATIAVAPVAMRDGRAIGLRFGMGLAAGLAFWAACSLPPAGGQSCKPQVVH